MTVTCYKKELYRPNIFQIFLCFHWIVLSCVIMVKLVIMINFRMLWFIKEPLITLEATTIPSYGLMIIDIGTHVFSP